MVDSYQNGGHIVYIPINRIAFFRNTKHLIHTGKVIYTLIRKRKNVNSYWIDDKIESWILNSDFIVDKEREFMVRISTLIKTDIPRSLSNNHLFRNPCEANRLDFPSHGKSFSLRLALSPPRGILVIDFVGTGRSYSVKYLATNSYVPLIIVSLNKFLDKYPKFFLPRNEDNCYNLDRYDSDYLDRNHDSHLEFLSMEDLIPEDIIPEIDRFFLTLQFKLAKPMDFEKSSPRNVLVIASTHISQKVDPALRAPNKLNTCI
ncbi:Ycf2-like protein [Medicago truncatula]|uniref:Protein Ycf2 n=1 Tax=Medicago truncatula TaxID=3880 RepID=G7KDK9_MEDTR|nr:Ycf2-like protein [Medicago truncatula]